MNIKKYAVHSDLVGFGCEILYTLYPPKITLIEECLENISLIHIHNLRINYKEFLDCDLVILLCSTFVGSTSGSCFSRKLSIADSKAYNFIHAAGMLDIPLLAVSTNGFTNNEQCMFYPNHFIILEDELRNRLKEYNLNQDSKVIVFVSTNLYPNYTNTVSSFRYILKELEKYDN